MLDTIVKTNLSTLTDSFHNNVVKHHDDNDHADGGMVPMMLIVLVKKVIVYTSTNMHTHTTDSQTITQQYSHRKHFHMMIGSFFQQQRHRHGMIHSLFTSSHLQCLGLKSP